MSEANSTATVRIHGQSKTIDISLDGMSVQEFVSKFKDVFGIPDNATPLVNGREGETIAPGDTVSFQTRASSKA